MAKKRVPGGDSKKAVPFDDYFTSMLNAITESAFLMTPEGVVLAANRAVAMRFGFKNGDDLQGRNILELHSPEVAEFRREQVSRVVATGEPIQFEDLRSGRHILNSIYPVFDQSGSVSRLAVFGMDITDRKRAEEAQRESEERFKALHNASFGGIAIHDKGLILDCNRGLSEITGYSQEELIGMDGLLLIAEKSREMVMNNILCGYEKPYEAFGLRKNGDEYPVQLRAKNIPHRGKRVRVVEFRDITEKRKAEELLRESERKYRTLAENMKDVIWTMDPETMMFTYVSPSVTRLRGYTPAEVMAEPMDKAFTDENSKAMRAMIKKGREDFLAGRISPDSFFTEEIEQPCKDGSTVWTEAITRFLLNPDTGRVEIHGVTRDISERRKAEQEYQTLFREMLDGFALHEIICDEDGKPADYRFLAVNPAFERMTGFKAEEMLGKTVLTVMPGTEPSWIEAYGKVA
ncbi:MAG: PAS domain S-box protein, partial [Thermovirgaceae bacterium]|nr:PAS domain S-box protein [Thermovirgaceae bacterium]